jgi:ABC-type nitrate/sulfonate/bicarbonate transport system ATPase subunit
VALSLPASLGPAPVAGRRPGPHAVGGRPRVTTPALHIDHVSKTFAGPDGRPLPVLADLSLTVAPGAFVSLVGPSGSGKSTLFSLIAGLERPDGGRILLDGRDITGRTGLVAYMPQRDLLLPWRSLLDNAILALEVQRVPRQTARARARALLDRFGLAGFERAYPAALSGGMRQRAALLRTVLAGRSLLLLDEPFGALDALTRADLQAWLLDIWAAMGLTVLFVTHDVDEALFLSDTVHLLSPRPARVALTLPVDLPRPRHPEVVTSPAHVALKARLLAALRAPLARATEGAA